MDQPKDLAFFKFKKKFAKLSDSSVVQVEKSHFSFPGVLKGNHTTTTTHLNLFYVLKKAHHLPTKSQDFQVLIWTAHLEKEDSDFKNVLFFHPFSFTKYMSETDFSDDVNRAIYTLLKLI